jgi:hypothetical protein
MFQEAFDVFRAEPDVNSSLLSDRETNEAYPAYTNGEQYSVYFTDGGDVGLDLKEAPGRFVKKWLDITNSQWLEEQEISGGEIIELKTPGEGHWIVVVSSR